MNIGVPAEVMPQEYRTGMTPAVAGSLVTHGHRVLVQRGAGAAAGYSDAAYAGRDCELVPDAAAAWGESDLVVKVKQPLPQEYPHLRPGLQLYCFLHLAAEPELTRVLMERRVQAVAAETVQTPDGALPALAPMSEIAGKLTLQVGSHLLSKPGGGPGKLLSGVVGVPPAKVLVVGGDTVGTAAARMALGVGAEVTVLDRSHRRLVYLQESLHGNLVTMLSNELVLADLLPQTDLLVGAVLVAGARTPVVVPRTLIGLMPPGSVAIDVSIDQGGCLETSRPTHHGDPVYTAEGVTHYCVVNRPGSVPRTSSQAFSASSYPFVARLAAEGVAGATRSDSAVALGVNTFDGQVVYPAVAEAHGIAAVPLQELVGAAA